MAAILLAQALQAAPEKGPAERRAVLLQQAAKGAGAVPALAAGLQDENLVVRRTAVRLLTDAGEAARPALISALDNSDALVRRAALVAVCTPLKPEALPHLKKGIKDSDQLMRLTSVQLLVQLKPQTQEIHDLLNEASKDGWAAVREVAAAAVWPFFKETVSIRDRTDWDHDIKVSQTIPLAKEGWRFMKDPKADGHKQKWYETGFDDSKWQPIEIEKAWEEQGNAGYDGVAWYRGTFDLPAKPQQLATEIAFEGVDEVAWVWINGQYAGQHDLGTDGWNIPFALDVSKELKWGEKNQITVRVYDSAYAGGIWKPVAIQVLQ